MENSVVLNEKKQQQIRVQQIKNGNRRKATKSTVEKIGVASKNRIAKPKATEATEQQL